MCTWSAKCLPNRRLLRSSGSGSPGLGRSAGGGWGRKNTSASAASVCECLMCERCRRWRRRRRRRRPPPFAVKVSFPYRLACRRRYCPQASSTEHTQTTHIHNRKCVTQTHFTSLHVCVCASRQRQHTHTHASAYISRRRIVHIRTMRVLALFAPAWLHTTNFNV